MDVTVIHNVSLKPYNSLDWNRKPQYGISITGRLCELMDRYRGFKHIVVLGKSLMLFKDYYSDEYCCKSQTHGSY